ncbi:F-box domain protein [Colletotrichum scovillei]|uniref:F-box domain protein n=1 Tax=Colletotrichum scovillei TaxID=1209932 RepID=UPI0015C3A3CD|nr:F-box domain protein [Colletotrichum scovillei]KAF4780142.1 F-box domain protein [Colletotrichum scovillei]
MGTKTGLANLPTELVHQILESIAVPVRARRNEEGPQLSPSRESRRALKNISQTCRVIRELATPLLSKHLCFFMHPSSDFELYALLQWWSSRPGQALAVQSLYIGAKEEGASSRPQNEDGLAFTASEMAFLQAAAEQSGLQVTEDWLQPGIQRTRVLAMMVLLQVRNIKTLELSINIKGFLRCLPAGSVGFPTHYDALTDIRLGKNTLGTFDTTDEDDPHSGSSDARRLLESAPQRETVHLDFFAGNHREWSAIDWSSVRNLHLRRLESDDVRVTDLATFSHIVHACRGLRELSICLDGVERIDGQRGELMRHIAAHKKTLRELDVAWDLLDEREEWAAVAMMQRCQNLELLKLPQSLAPWGIIERLPPNTRWLYVPTDYSLQRDGQHGHFEWLNNFSCLDGPLYERVFEDGSLPNLEGVVIPAFVCPHGQQCLSALKNELSKGFVQKFPTPSSLETDVAIVECKVSRNVREGLFMLLESGLPCGVEFDDLRCKVEMQPGHAPSPVASELQVKLIPSVI